MVRLTENMSGVAHDVQHGTTKIPMCPEARGTENDASKGDASGVIAQESQQSSLGNTQRSDTNAEDIVVARRVTCLQSIWRGKRSRHIHLERVKANLPWSPFVPENTVPYKEC